MNRTGTVVLGTLTLPRLDPEVEPIIGDVIATIPVTWGPVNDPSGPTLAIVSETGGPVTITPPGCADAWGLLDEHGTLLWWEKLRHRYETGDVFTLLPWLAR